MRKLVLAGAIAVAAMAPGAALAMDGDVEAGEKVYKKCQACHVVDSDKNKVGPTLAGVMGRNAAAVEGFKYSKAMIAFGEENVWDEETMAAYLAAPKKVVKGTKMAFAGLKKDEDIANVIAYIKQFTPE